MKTKIFYLLALALCFGSLSSCVDDDLSDIDVDSFIIVGDWEYFKEGEIINGTEVLEKYENECATKKDHIDFKQSGTVNDYDYDENCVENMNTGTYSVKNKKLSITIGGITTDVDILHLTGKTLKISYQVTVDGSSHTYVNVFKAK